MSEIRELLTEFFKSEGMSVTRGQARRLRPFIARCVEYSKKGANWHAYKKLNWWFRDLYTDIGPRFAFDKGGYFRIFRTAFRMEDKAVTWYGAWSSIIKFLSEVLKKQTYLASHDISIADYFALDKCSASFALLKDEERVKLYGLTRWFNTVQKSVWKNSNGTFNLEKVQLNFYKELDAKKSIESSLNETPAVKQTKDTKKENEKKTKTEKDKNQKPKANAQKETTDDVPAICKLDVRVGKVLSVKKHEQADSLYVEQIDVGEEKPRTIVSGLVKYMTAEELQGKMLLVMCNLKPARGVLSEGMVLAASDAEKTKVELLVPPPGAIAGDVISFGDFERKPESILNPKKKIFESVQPDFTTDDKLVAYYKDAVFQVKGKGVVKAPSIAKANIK
ncbi:nucleic acid-binding protein [Rozella allomycis CSF55]|uniref:Nucleic acid-binding protein n=1 Tax=Rozella allomycis (strain CSF55) TaxID=988480 RepID=A0A4P9YPY5_ROZAC|nr:nucleic acid-binding protein [Rozella allomycis CSF55]